MVNSGIQRIWGIVAADRTIGNSAGIHIDASAGNAVQIAEAVILEKKAALSVFSLNSRLTTSTTKLPNP